MGGIYEVRHWDGLMCYDIHTKFHKDWFNQSKVYGGITDTQKARRQHKPKYFQNKESTLIKCWPGILFSQVCYWYDYPKLCIFSRMYLVVSYDFQCKKMVFTAVRPSNLVIKETYHCLFLWTSETFRLHHTNFQTTVWKPNGVEVGEGADDDTHTRCFCA
jgi:hypothetical protein